VDPRISEAHARLENAAEMAAFLARIPNADTLEALLKERRVVSTRAYDDETMTARFVRSNGQTVACYTVTDVTIDEAEMIAAQCELMDDWNVGSFAAAVHLALDADVPEHLSPATHEGDATMGISVGGLVSIACAHGVEDTVRRLESLFQSKGIMVFANIDFSGDAARAGLSLRPERMLIFGNPKAGTPLMVDKPSVGLDLPLKALVFEDAAGKVWMAYNDPDYIVRRHGVNAALKANLAAAIPLLENAAKG
jgi:uncharacterized protein (DUF302 family)